MMFFLVLSLDHILYTIDHNALHDNMNLQIATSTFSLLNDKKIIKSNKKDFEVQDSFSFFILHTR